MPPTDRFLRTVEAVHAAAVDDSLWPDALKQVTRLFGAVGTTLEDFNKHSLTLRDFRVVGLPDGAADPYLEYYARHNPRAAYALRHLAEQTLCDYQFIDERGMDRDPYYAKYLTSIDLRYFLSGQIANTPDTQAVVTIQRSRRQGHAARADVERMRRLLPHLRQAWNVTTRLRGAERAVRSFELTLDWLTDGVALLRGDGRLLYANESFRAIARRGDGMHIRRGAIEIIDPVGRARFATAIRTNLKIRHGEYDSDLGDIAIARRGGASPYIVSVRPLVEAARERKGTNADLIVFVRDPLARNAATLRLLCELFGFTPAEAALAHALQRGVSPATYARESGLSPNTVYTHLRLIKEKTGCHRMAELIRKLNDVHVPLRAK